MEKTLAYFISNIKSVTEERLLSKGMQNIKIHAYLMIIFPPGVKCFSGHTDKYWTIEFFSGNIDFPVATIELFGIPQETEPFFDGKSYFRVGDACFDLRVLSDKCILEKIIGEDTLHYGEFLDKFFSETKFPQTT